jgi:metal transporter CNNM
MRILALVIAMVLLIVSEANSKN